jgi:hypothetical protein
LGQSAAFEFRQARPAQRETTLNLARSAILTKFSGGEMLDTDRVALLTDQLLNVIMTELEREPRTPDNVWCVLDAVACVVAGLIKDQEALRYYRRALNLYSGDFAARSS